jgi:hypothetical protein
LGFRGVQASNLTGWSGNRRDPAWRHFVESVRAISLGKAVPERTPPRPRTKMSSVILGALGVMAALLTMLGTAEQFGVIHLTRATTSVRQPSLAERAAWARARDSHDCGAIRSFVSANPGGPFAGEAQAILAARRSQPDPTWAPFVEPQMVTGSSNIDQRQTQAAACQSARDSALRNSRRGCDLYNTDAAHFRNMSPEMSEMTCDCADRAIRFDGPGSDEIQPIWRCTVRTSYQCRGEMLEQRTREYCGE